MEPVRSVSFDRAADFYDRTRSLEPAVAAAQTDLLVAQLQGAPGPCLEIGVGTGRIAVPVAERGPMVVGLDLSAPMLDRLRAKDPHGSVPAVLGDAAALPFGAGAFGAAIACHVLHLVADWTAVVDELRRVLRPGGVLLAARGAARQGLMADVVQRIRAAASAASAAPAPPRRAGLDSLDELDAHLSASGARVEHLPPLERAPATDGPTVGDYLDELVDGVYSWTWDLPPDQLRAAVEEVRQWVADEHGDPARLPVPFQPIRWHRYVLDPGGA